MRKENITWRAFKHYSSYNKKYFPLAFLHIVFQQISPYFNLWMSAEIVSSLYAGKAREDILTLVAIALLGNLLIHVLGALLGRYVNIELRTLSDNEGAAFNRKTMSLDYDKLENPDIRTLRRKIKENTYINNYGVAAMRFGILGMFRCIISLAFAMVLFAEMIADIIKAGFHPVSILLMAGLAGFTVLSIVYNNHAQKKSAERDKMIGDFMLKENQFGRGDAVHGMDARMYRQQDIVAQRNNKLHEEHLRLFSWEVKQRFLDRIPFTFLSKIPEICAYLIVCFYCTSGIFPVGGVIKYVGYLNRVILNIFDVFSNITWLKNNEPFLEPYLEYFDIPNDMYQGSLAVEKRSDKKYDIEFKNVSFKYAGSENYALKNINLRFKVGERLAVVGMNGSGKTTFIKLMCRLYDPTEGEICMNDFNIRKYDYRQYLDIFSVVFQDYLLLALPLGNGVSASATWDEEKAERCLREVGFGERYDQMPKKLDTPIYKYFDDEGVNISGGEKQKIALARALYRDAPFIILDEPTAALDPIAEAEIYSKFDEIVGDKTAIYISHRLSSCRFCDKIVVFDQGEIVQIGTHEELLTDENGKYYEMWHAQAQYYTENKAS